METPKWILDAEKETNPDQTYTYIAYTRKCRITSVVAKNTDEAKAKVRQTLDRPGRRQILLDWEMAGSVVWADYDA